MNWGQSGILLVDKDPDWTSHDVCALIRSRFKIEKVGHAGTLDPMATGVLVILLGQATKLSQEFSSSDKEYAGAFQLGITTDSFDISGKILSETDWQNVGQEDVLSAFKKFEGVIDQIPPMVSAVKHQGVPLYRLARKGKTVEREKRTVTVHRFKVESIKLPEVRFFAHVSKGTYLRALVNDLGQMLGCGATLTELRRTRSGNFGIDEAIKTEDLKRMNFEQLRPYIKSLSSLNIIKCKNQEKVGSQYSPDLPMII